MKYQRANNLDPKVNKPPYRRHLDVTKEAELKICQSLLKEKAITVEVYIEKILGFYDFHRQKEKEPDSESDELSTDEESEEEE